MKGNSKLTNRKKQLSSVREIETYSSAEFQYDEFQYEEFTLEYRPPFDWNWMLAFIADRTPGGVEWIHDGRYLRTIATKTCSGVVHAFQSKDTTGNRLTVRISSTLASESEDILRRLRNLFDLDCDPEVVLRHLELLAINNPGVRVAGAFDNFESAVRIILGQLVSVSSASTFMRRYLVEFGRTIETPFPQLNLASPTPEEIAQLTPAEIAKKVRIPGARAVAIISLANAINDGILNLDDRSNPKETIRLLESLPGIGPWTAQYIALRILRWSDAFPHSDLGIRKALKLENKREILETAEKWRPWRSYAAMHLWNSLGHSE